MPDREEYKKRKVAYIRGYNKRHYRSVNIMFRTDDPEQKELWDFIHSKWSTAGYLRDLALKAMKEEKATIEKAEKEKEGE